MRRLMPVLLAVVLSVTSLHAEAKRMGGGSSFGGGAGRGGGGCACASSCACACACAGGGRAGCSAKNLYGVIHLPEEALADSDETDRHSR